MLKLRKEKEGAEMRLQLAETDPQPDAKIVENGRLIDNVQRLSKKIVL